MKRGLLLFVLLSGLSYAQVYIDSCGLLDQPNTEYILTQDVEYDGTCFVIKGDGIILNLNGHTATFGEGGSEWSHGILCHPSYAGGRPSTWAGGGDNIIVKNGQVVQKNINTRLPDRSSGTGSHAIYFRSNDNVEFYNLTITSNAINDATILRLRSVTDAHIHDVTINNNVQEILDRHYPGQSSIWIEGGIGNYEINNVVINGGPHRGMVFTGDFDTCNVHDNTISHNQKYVNGYAFGIAGSGIEVHHNTVVPIEGRGMHITGHDNIIHHNYLDLTVGPVIDHNAGQTNYHEIFVNVHGIKFEGSNSRNNKVYSNTVIATQPDNNHAPPTPLNIDSSSTNANNEVYNNNFSAYTYAGTASGYGGYGDFATYATGIITYGCPGNGAYIHHNIFNIDDVAIYKNSYDCSLQIESNQFILNEGHVSNYRAFDTNRGSGTYTLIDNEFIGFEPVAAAHVDLSFRLVGKTIPNHEVTIGSNSLTADSNGEFQIDLAPATYNVIIGTDSYTVELDRSKYVDFGSVEYVKCDQGTVDSTCLCDDDLVNSGYCCFDLISTEPCESFALQACSELSGSYCDLSTNTCDDNAYSSDYGIECCIGTCSTNPVSCDEADTSDYGTISMNELISFINQWKQGSATIVQLMDAIQKWKNGC